MLLAQAWKCVCFLIISGVTSTETGKFRLALSEAPDRSELERLLRGEERALVCFTGSPGAAVEWENKLQEVEAQGTGAGLYLVDCSGEGHLLCKDMDLRPEPVTLHYYRRGTFDRPYVGKGAVATIVKFLENPEEDLPWEDVDSAVVHLEEWTWKAFLRQKRHALVMFYAPWCGHCRAAKPGYERAAGEMSGKGRFAFAAVDCTKEQSLCVSERVRGYPTINYYNYYNMSPVKEYAGQAKKDDLLEFMAKMDEEFRRRRSKDDL